jgi:hypothetical protein
VVTLFRADHSGVAIVFSTWSGADHRDVPILQEAAQESPQGLAGWERLFYDRTPGSF